MSRAVSVTELYNKKRAILNLEGVFLHAFGKMERAGTIFIHGRSRNGKSTLVAMIAKYFTRFGRVAYNSLEEGISETLKINFKRVGMGEVKSRIIVLDKEPIHLLTERLRKQKAPNIVIIDSIQYVQIKFEEYKAMCAEFSDVLFIVVSQSKGKEPKGVLADAIFFHADIKIWVEGYVAFVASRYITGDSKPIVIWKEGADKYHNQEF